jgi:DNA-binding transcriptional ArsR family regulator
MRQKCFEAAKKLSVVLSSISNPTRFLIMSILCEKEMYVGQLREELGTSKGNISQHLRILSDRGLIQSRKVGNRVYYSLENGQEKNLVKKLRNSYCPDFQI